MTDSQAPRPGTAAVKPRGVRPRQVWRTLTVNQQQQVLRSLVTMCQECLLLPTRETAQEVCDD